MSFERIRQVTDLNLSKKKKRENGYMREIKSFDYHPCRIFLYLSRVHKKKTAYTHEPSKDLEAPCMSMMFFFLMVQVN